jgi:hypothetical protein
MKAPEGSTCPVASEIEMSPTVSNDGAFFEFLIGVDLAVAVFRTRVIHHAHVVTCSQRRDVSSPI